MPNALIVSLVGYLPNKKNGKKGYLYNLMLKNIPYHTVKWNIFASPNFREYDPKT